MCICGHIQQTQTQRPFLSENDQHIGSTLSPGVFCCMISGSGSLDYGQRSSSKGQSGKMINISHSLSLYMYIYIYIYT